MALADGPGVWTEGSHEGPTEFGITLPAPPHRSQEEFEGDLARLKSLGMTWARFAVVADTVVENWGFAEGAVSLDPDVLDRIARAAAAAQEAGLKVCMVMADIYDAPEADEAEFLRNMRQYWAGVVAPLAEHVDVWQILNEPDGAHFRTMEDVAQADRPEYLRMLARTLGAAHDELERVDAHVTMTTNLYGYPLGDAMEERWTESLDAIAPHLDVITVDAYPELSREETLELPDRVSRLRERYGKEVMIGEMGLQTCTDCATEEQQAEAYRLYLENLQDSVISVLFFYQLRDTGEDTGEGTFGIEESDGTDKPAAAVIEELLGT
jgi:hypothetical protein